MNTPIEFEYYSGSDLTAVLVDEDDTLIATFSAATKPAEQTVGLGLYRVTYTGSGTGRHTLHILDGGEVVDVKRYVLQDTTEVHLPTVSVSTDMSGTGPNLVTITVTDDSDPANDVENARVSLSMPGATKLGFTDEDGVAVFNLDAGTWTVTITKAGLSFSGTTLVVDGTETPTYEMTLDVTPSVDPATTTCYFECRDEDAAIEEGVTVYLRQLTAPGTAGTAGKQKERSAVSNASGIAQFAGVYKDSTVEVRRGDQHDWLEVDIPSTAGPTTPLDSVLGTV